MAGQLRSTAANWFTRACTRLSIAYLATVLLEFYAPD